jgi:uncharacterized protein YqiB (DUF1249 family)
MLADSYIVPECVVKPRSFGGLMALYETNFVRLSHLIDRLDVIAGERVSRCASDFPLYLSIENRTRYTCELRLSYHFLADKEASEAIIADPDLSARVYFDARMVEVCDWAQQHRHALLKSLHNSYRTELDRRWANNIILSKWLEYLTDRGHSFPG